VTLTSCRECGQAVSDKAATCPHCGIPAPAQRAAAGRPRSSGNAAGILIIGLVLAVVVVVLNGAPKEGVSGSASSFDRNHRYHLKSNYVACTDLDDLKRLNNLSRDTDAIARFMGTHTTCFFTSSAAGRESSFEGREGLGYVRMHAAGHSTLFYTYTEALAE
jgi:hypothetical protein